MPFHVFSPPLTQGRAWGEEENPTHLRAVGSSPAWPEPTRVKRSTCLNTCRIAGQAADHRLSLGPRRLLALVIRQPPLVLRTVQSLVRHQPHFPKIKGFAEIIHRPGLDGLDSRLMVPQAVTTMRDKSAAHNPSSARGFRT